MRTTGNYRLDGEDPSIRASGLTVLDFSMVKQIRPWVDFNFSVDNLTDKNYYETQNYFELRLRPGDPGKWGHIFICIFDSDRRMRIANSFIL